jgi:hypothetical protein
LYYLLILRIESAQSESGLTGAESLLIENMVGAAGFEPATSCSQSMRATRLRYAPTVRASILFDLFFQAFFQFLERNRSVTYPVFDRGPQLGNCFSIVGNNKDGIIAETFITFGLRSYFPLQFSLKRFVAITALKEYQDTPERCPPLFIRNTGQFA